MAENALRFVEGRTYEEMEHDMLLTFALSRALEIFGEAASKIAPQTRGEMATVPWGAIMGMRNRLAHAYHDVNPEVLWRTATEDLPPLLPILRAVLAGDAEPR